MSARLLEVIDLTVGFRRRGSVLKAVDGVSFHVDEGETLGIVGESGCGKSTTGLALLRLVGRGRGQNAAGKVLFQGQDLFTMSERALRQLRGRDLSMILQDPMASLNPVFTVGDQIGEAVLAHGKCPRGRCRANVVEALRQVRIPSPETRAGDYPHQMSGGMKQRAVGAVAISCRPRLLIADEPTTSLDVTVQAQYLDLLKELQRELGMALIFITHDFGVVARMCDRVAVMYAGRIVETAPVRELFYRPAHWYTAALIGGIPKLDADVERLVSIPGSPPKLDAMPPGCRFSPRCPNAQEKCRREAPASQAFGEAHQASCWYPRSGR